MGALLVVFYANVLRSLIYNNRLINVTPHANQNSPANGRLMARLNLGAG